MTAAHIAAALLVAWTMQRADAACSAVGERLRGALGGALAGLLVRLVPAGARVPVPRILRPVGERAQEPPRNSPVLAHAMTRRGPPAGPAPAI
ncbi:hypothetical protein [Streptomyces sp. NBC_01506]|uniref:hypothetical protein n=1 Tax=Streptomyces sp. NBC_01506 TaxID=2903887 RepID=UPI003863C089